MFGSVFHMTPRPGHEQQLQAQFERWNKERAPKVKGYVETLGLRKVDGSGQLIGVAVFASREDYERNAQDPEQDAWYRELRSHLTEDPMWEDGEVVYRATA